MVFEHDIDRKRFWTSLLEMLAYDIGMIPSEGSIRDCYAWGGGISNDPASHEEPCSHSLRGLFFILLLHLTVCTLTLKQSTNSSILHFHLSEYLPVS